MSIVFLFGAGASYGSGDCSPNPPPLGKDLFPELLRRGGFAATLDEELRSLFNDNFELGMDRFIDTHNIQTPTLLREMSEYFIPFTPGPNNLYRRLVNFLRQRQDSLAADIEQRVVLATTNYDLLLEHATLDSRCGIVYPTIVGRDSDLLYAKPPEVALMSGPVPRSSSWANMSFSYTMPAFEVLKVHGSCNFLLDIQPESMRGITYENVQVAVEAPVEPVWPPEQVVDYLNRSDSSLAPAISMYAEGKPVLFSAEYVREHQRRLQAAVEEADKIFLVGIRVWPPDTHIWDHIASSTSWLGYVGFDHEEFSSWCEEKGRSNYHILERSFEDALPRIEQELDAATP